MPDSAAYDTSRTLSQTPFVAPDRERTPTCSRCHYSGTLQRTRAYPLFLTWYAIAGGLCCGVLPGLLLWWWRRGAEPTIAMTCPQCDFLRLECRLD